jgi:hypothetical protein
MRLTEAAGRDPSALQFSLTLPLAFTAKPPSAPVQDRTALTGTDDHIAETVRAYRDAGLDEIVIGVSSGDRTENADAMAAFMERIVPKLS